ncbi:MAG: hypothetical protein ACKVQC_02985 [Elusimicrobiota bacterium]
MKKFFISSFLVLIGAGVWWFLAHAAQSSVKNWDASFDTILKNTLHEMNTKDEDIVSSVHEMLKDKSGSWVFHKMKVKLTDKDQIAQIKKKFEDSGGEVKHIISNGLETLKVYRGARPFQEVEFVPE